MVPCQESFVPARCSATVLGRGPGCSSDAVAIFLEFASEPDVEIPVSVVSDLVPPAVVPNIILLFVILGSFKC